MKTYYRICCTAAPLILSLYMTLLANEVSAASMRDTVSGRIRSSMNRRISPPTIINGQEVDVHALIILGPGSDEHFRSSVLNNKDQMVKMLKKISYHCDIYTTIMESESASKGIISKMAFADSIEWKPETTKQGIIRSQQVVEWLENLNSKPEDIILIYYSGPGEIGASSLLFGTGSNGDEALDRKTLSQKLEQKSARLRMLITDGNHFMEKKTGDVHDSTDVALPPDPAPKLRLNGIVNLFFGHIGFLDIAAASPRTQDGWAAATSEDFFTSVLVSQVYGTVGDANEDYFISWEDALASVVHDMEPSIQSMVPKASSLPVPVRP